MPTIKPALRTSLTPASFLNASLSNLLIKSPIFCAFSRSFSSAITSSVVKPAVVANGLPPNVEPCLPGTKVSAAAPRAKQAPIGTPEPKPLARLITSGKIPAC